MESLLGQILALRVLRLTSPGAYLAIDPRDTRPDAEGILLPGGEIPEGAAVGTDVEVFVYLDSEDRPIATTKLPRLSLGEVAFLEVKDLTPIGAFVDWGLPKELLVPFAEQTRDVRKGERHPIGLYIDKSGRLAGTMRVTEMLGGRDVTFERDAWIEGEAWRSEPGIGLFVIVERRRVGLVPENEPHKLSRGEAARFRVSNVLADGKIELSLRAHAHEELATDGQRIVEILSRPGAARVGDASSPETIRQVFGLSKKAFKRAVGRLLREQTVRIDDDGLVVPVRRKGPSS